MLLIYIHKTSFLLHTVLFWRAWKQLKEKPSSEAAVRSRISSHLLVNNPGNKFGPAAAALLKYFPPSVASRLQLWFQFCCWTELLQNPLLPPPPLPLGLEPDLFPPCFCQAVGKVVWNSVRWEPAAGISQPILVEDANYELLFLIMDPTLPSRPMIVWKIKVKKTRAFTCVFFT